MLNCKRQRKPPKKTAKASLVHVLSENIIILTFFRNTRSHLTHRTKLFFIIVITNLMLGGLLQGLNNPGGNGEQNQEAPKEIDWTLLDKAVDKILKFNTEEESFDRTYPKVDHLQRYFNEKAVNHFVEAITKKYQQEQQPLSILDVCCGYGLPTTTVRERLLQNGVKIQRIVGYDVSEDMINFDKHNNPLQPQVHFQKVNIETQLKDVEQFDVAFCLFGLHWMNDLQGAVFRIARSLKKGGLFLSLTPIEIKDLFDYRQNFVEYSKWSTAIAQNMRILHPFHYNKQDYTSVLEKHFVTVYEEKKETKFNYTRKQYLTFLQSWLQEVRHLTNDVNHELKKQAVAQAYISDFIDSIDKNLNGNIIIHEDGSIIYTQHTFDYDGIKK